MKVDKANHCSERTGKKRRPLKQNVMPQEGTEMLTEDDIALELEHYQKFNTAFLRGKHDSDLPRLPVNKDEQHSRFLPILGLLLHPILGLFIGVSRLLHAHWFTALLSKARIATDGLSYEPRACGLHKAYTNLGLALFGRNNLSGAIKCLNASWRVHPCPHNCSFGLSRALVAKLRDYPEAAHSVQEYIRIGKTFVVWSEDWAQKI